MKKYLFITCSLALTLLAGTTLIGCSDNNEEPFAGDGGTCFLGVIAAIPEIEDSLYLLVTDGNKETDDLHFVNSIFKVCKKEFPKSNFSVGTILRFSLVDCAMNIAEGFPPLGGLNSYYSCHLSNVVFMKDSSYISLTDEVVSSIGGQWYLESYTHGFGIYVLFDEDELSFTFNTDGTLEASFLIGEQLFRNYGLYQCSTATNMISINGLTYYYSLTGETMLLDGGSAYDGPTIVLKKSK